MFIGIGLGLMRGGGAGGAAGDTTAPTLTSPTDTATGTTTADLGVTTDEGNGTLYWVVTTSGTAPTKAQVKAGQDNSSVAATASGSQAVSSTGAKTASATGLSAGTAYTAHFMHEDAAGNQSTVASGNGLTTTFDPTTLSLNLWLDPSDLTASFQLSNGTTAAVVDSPIGYGGDKSGNGNHCIQATAGARPILKQSGALYFWRFDGVNDVLGGPIASSFLTVSTFDIVCAGLINTLTTNVADASVYDNDCLFAETGQFIGLHFKSGSGGLISAYNWDTAADVISDSLAAATPFVAHMRHSGGNLSLTLNANSTVTTASGNTSSLSGTFHLGNGVGVFTDLDLYGFAARKTLFSAPELAALKTWMGNKIGLVL